MDLGLMAKAFAHMASDQQAKFLALVHHEMEQYPKRDGEGTLGSYGRQMQMLAIKDHLDENPGAEEFIDDLYEMTIIKEDEDRASLPPVVEEHLGGKVVLAGFGRAEYNGEYTLTGRGWNPPIPNLDPFNCRSALPEDVKAVNAQMNSYDGDDATSSVYEYAKGMVMVDQGVGTDYLRDLLKKYTDPAADACAMNREQMLIDALDVVETTVDWPGVNGQKNLGRLGDPRMSVHLQPRITCRIKQQDPPLHLIDPVTIDGNVIGHVTEVHDDDTVSVVMYPQVAEPVNVNVVNVGDADQAVLDAISRKKDDCSKILELDTPNGGKLFPAADRKNYDCDCGAQVGQFHKDDCNKLLAQDRDGFISHRRCPAPVPATEDKPKCDECKGTGWYVGLSAKEPCSQGCQPS